MSNIDQQAYHRGYEELALNSECVSEFKHSFLVSESGQRKNGKIVTIGIVNTKRQKESALRLLNDRYGWRGYGCNHDLDGRHDSVTFEARCEGEIIGTLTLSVDSAAGLNLDKTFPEEMDSFRSSTGARICELTKFAFKHDGDTRFILAALFHTIFIYGTSFYSCTDLFIEVNPRHQRFYEKMLGFRSIGKLKMNERVEAPSQLMSLKVSDIRCFIDEAVGKEGNSCRSLYQYFFPVHEEFLILSKMMGMVNNGSFPGENKFLPLRPDNAGTMSLPSMV